MKLLEELRREQVRKRDGLEHTAKATTRTEPASEAVQQAMETLYSELADLADGLNQLDTDVLTDYEIESVGVLRGLQQRAYAVVSEDPGLPRFSLGFECAGRSSLSATAATIAEREALMARLSDLGLSFSVDGTSACRYAVFVKPVVPVRLVFAPTPDGRAIRLTAMNLNRLGRELFSIRPADASEEFAGELGKLILRRGNRFSEMTGNCVSLEARARLRERLNSQTTEAQARPGPAHGKQADGRGQRHPSRGHSRPAPASPRRAPVMVNEHSQAEGWVNWTGDSLTLPNSTLRSAGEAPAAAAATPGANDGAFKLARYAWVITTDALNTDPSESIAKRGPRGTSQAFPTSEVVNDGEDFRLLAVDGEVRYGGMILGKYQGIEPLLEFGHRHGCVTIAYRRDGRWVPLQAEG